MTPETGNPLVVVRVLKGWSQREAARRMGISNTTLGKIERGSIPITPEMRAAVAAAYDWPEDWVENRPVLNPPGDLENRVARLERDLAAVRDMVAAHLRLLEREVDQARRDRAEDP